MEYSPMPLEEKERSGIGRDFDLGIAVAALQRLFLLGKENEQTSE